MADTATNYFSLVIFFLVRGSHVTQWWPMRCKGKSAGYSFWESFCFTGRNTNLTGPCLAFTSTFLCGLSMKWLEVIMLSCNHEMTSKERSQHTKYVKNTLIRKPNPECLSNLLKIKQINPLTSRIVFFLYILLTSQKAILLAVSALVPNARPELIFNVDYFV